MSLSLYPHANQLSLVREGILGCMSAHRSFDYLPLAFKNRASLHLLQIVAEDIAVELRTRQTLETRVVIDVSTSFALGSKLLILNPSSSAR